MTVDQNYSKYMSNEVVKFYEKQTELQDCEAYLFQQWLKPGMAILDIGVGGGRTTPALSSIAGRYVGADYSRAMVDICHEKWPNLSFMYCDATEMASYRDGEFDAVVFSFNGIDVIRSDESRWRCLSETARVLKDGGIFIFSSHNASILGVWPQWKGASGLRIPWRIVRSIGKSASLCFRNITRLSWWKGEGYIHDPVHGGMDHYVSTPRTMIPQLNKAGLEVLETVGGHYPRVKSIYLTPWTYYACRRISGT
jgi:ubiquinone/menaquinone biosynthesis C-methylase UbiE